MAEIKRVSFTHEAFANWLIENPHRSLRDAAEYFNYTQAWLSQILHSDAFQEVLKRKQAIVSAVIMADLPGKLRGVADVALTKLGEKIEKSEDPDFLLDATDKLLHRMGYAPSSARNPGAITIQNNTVNQTIAVPQEALAQARNALLARAQIPVAIPQEIEVLPIAEDSSS